ncbi:MAG: type VI secretion system tip protein TssI/VgrG [Anaeromyxobacter sp.]
MTIAGAALAANAVEFELTVGPHAADDLLVVAFEAEERLSAPYAVDVTVAIREGTEVDAAALVAEPGCLTVQLGDGSTRCFDGIVSAVRRWDEGPAQLERRLRVTLVPSLWRLGCVFRSRIFQDLTVPEIVEQVLSDAGITDLEQALSGDYAKRGYTVQHQETDLDFVQRLLEAEGIFYFFKHAQGSHTLVLGDAPSVHEPIEGGEASLPFHAQSGMTGGEQVDELAASAEVLPGKVTLRDFDWQRPTTDLTQARDDGGADAALEVYEYPGGYVQGRDGAALARIRLEELRARAQRFSGATNCRRLLPGRTFELTGHPLGELDGEYLILSVAHHGDQSELLSALHRPDRRAGERRDPFRARFELQRKDVPFRPERRTPRPRAPGAETAIVVGPAGEEIHTDEHGRVKVQFHWDREGQRDDHSSCWIRVAQAWAGAGWGALYLPRIGQEVVVEFLGGDPDRPIVTGSVYNGANPPPVQLPGEKTRSTLRSFTSPGGDGFNELAFEDAAGREQVYFHAQRDVEAVVEHDRSETIGANDTLTVTGDQSATVGKSRAVKVTEDDRRTVGGSSFLEVGKDRTLTVGGSHTETVAGQQAVSVGGVQSVTVAMAAAETVGLGKALTVGGAYAVTVGGLMNELVGGLKAEEVGGAKVEVVGAKKTETVMSSRTVAVGGESSETVGKARSVKIGGDLLVSIGGKLTQAVKAKHELNAKEIVLSADDKLTLKVGSATIELKKSGDVVIKGAKVDVKASGAIVLKAATISEN